ncbi:uncharacterized protein LOC133034090 [Cannabis sativa]|uniref:uncharacterized protein LOC133034090 n=1 Tax=Cannabis sativa TaxID=3483 RepID=UPI0029CAA935|nr:uncharacterized protein LOC133034090 [Cannabis sativa]
MPKHRFIFWQTINTQLLAHDKFVQFQITLDNIKCPVCDTAAESNAHLFFDCYFSQQVVEQVCLWLGVRSWPTSFNSWQQWLRQTSKDKMQKVHISIMAVMIYSILSNKNNCLFNNYSSTTTKVTQEIKKIVYYRLQIAKNRSLKAHEKRYIESILV